MEAAIFADRKQQPSAANLTKTLGRTARYWTALVTQALDAARGAESAWKYYASGGWVYLVRVKRRNLLYLRPLAKGFLASFALSEPAIAAARATDLPPGLLAMLAAAPRYPEGRAVRIAVTSAATAAQAAQVLALKAAH
jgi:hypothetical protein